MMRFSTALAWLMSAGLLLPLAGSAAAAEQAYPTRPIHWISPFPPGGGSDILSRMIAPKLSESLGQQVIVDNRPGGNTIIGSDLLVKSAPDGYTILCADSGHVLVPLAMPVPFAAKDFAPISALASGSLILVVNLSLPANTLEELITLAKSKTGQLNYATWGSGSVSHLGMELFSVRAGIKMQHVPYKGGAPAITDVIGGHVQMYLSVLPSVIPHIKSGRLKAISVTGESRSSAVPQVPTFTEGGLPGIDVKIWHALLAPANTPKDIIARLSAEIERILSLPDVKAKLAVQGLQPFYSTPDQLAAMLKAETAKYTEVIKAAHIKFEN